MWRNGSKEILGFYAGLEVRFGHRIGRADAHPLKGEMLDEEAPIRIGHVLASATASGARILRRKIIMKWACHRCNCALQTNVRQWPRLRIQRAEVQSTRLREHKVAGKPVRKRYESGVEGVKALAFEHSM